MKRTVATSGLSNEELVRFKWIRKLKHVESLCAWSDGKFPSRNWEMKQEQNHQLFRSLLDFQRKVDWEGRGMGRFGFSTRLPLLLTFKCNAVLKRFLCSIHPRRPTHPSLRVSRGKPGGETWNYIKHDDSSLLPRYCAESRFTNSIRNR